MRTPVAYVPYRRCYSENTIDPAAQQYEYCSKQLFFKSLCRDELRYPGNEFFYPHSPLITVLAIAHGNLSRLNFPIPYNKHIRNLLKLCFPNLQIHFFAADVQLGPKIRGQESFIHFGRVGILAVGNRQHDHLNRREPQRKSAAVQFD